MKEIVRYAIADENGIVMACSAREEDAVYSRCNRAGCTIVVLRVENLDWTMSV